VAEGEGDVPSASISTHKGSRYSEVLSKLALTERTNLPFVSSTRSTLPERPKSPVKILPDQALAHPPTIQVHINNGKVEDDVLGGIHKGVKGAVRYGIFPRSLKVYILEVDEFLLLTDLLNKGFSWATHQRSRLRGRPHVRRRLRLEHKC
jgi:hypothetical protein